MEWALTVSNLPPKCRRDEIIEAFEHYGKVRYVSFCALDYMDKHYDLRIAYVFCSSPHMIQLFTDMEVDIVIRDYYLVIEKCTKSRYFNALVAVGFGKEVQPEDLKQICRNTSQIRINETCDFAFLLFESPEQRDAVKLTKKYSVKGYEVTVSKFPNPKWERNMFIRTSSDFMRLRNMERFQDFILKVPGKTLKVSKQVLAMSSQVIAQIPGNEFELDFEGNYDELIDALYGAQLTITSQNCRFLHAVASKLKVEELIINAGAVCYEELTMSNYSEVCQDLVRKDLDTRYVAEFIASHVLVTHSPLDARLPASVILQVARSPHLALLEQPAIESIFREALKDNKITRSDISSIFNREIDLDKNRELLVQYLESREKERS